MSEKSFLDGFLEMMKPPGDQPILIPPNAWQTAIDLNMLRKDGEKFFIGRNWVMKTEYMPQGRDQEGGK
jgi:hypothetical protein